MSIEEAILEKVRTLPPEKQNEVLEFNEALQAQSVDPKPPLKSLEGLWAEYDINISEEDIAELRREMWKNFRVRTSRNAGTGRGYQRKDPRLSEWARSALHAATEAGEAIFASAI